jgi:hypothetical protein
MVATILVLTIWVTIGAYWISSSITEVAEALNRIAKIAEKNQNGR